jgi:hypothetical protein
MQKGPIGPLRQAINGFQDKLLIAGFDPPPGHDRTRPAIATISSEPGSFAIARRKAGHDGDLLLGGCLACLA